MPLKIPIVDLTRQNLPFLAEFQERFRDIVERSAFVLGPEVKEFEDAFAAYAGTKHAVGCGNGTDALYLALCALDIGPGAEVITTPFTFSATVASVLRVGARAVLVDIDPVTYTIDPALVERAITTRTRAILPVHIYGQAADMGALTRIASERNIPIIEDCAQAHGAKWGGVKVGSHGAIGCFSFFPSKNLSALGDAGACVTSDDDLAARLRRLRVHGAENKMNSQELGANSRLDNIHAAFLTLKLAKLDDWNRSRQSAAKWYDNALAGLKGLAIPGVGAGREHVYHLYVVDVENRERVKSALDAGGIGCGIHYPIPAHLMPAFASLNYRAGDIPIAEGLCKRVLSLPMFPGITKLEVDEVCRVIREAIT